MARKWVERDLDIEEECMICCIPNKSGYVTTCCDKYTCQICYYKLRSVCPYCNIALDQSGAHNEQNNLEFDQHIKREADEFNESVARALEQEEQNQEQVLYPGLDLQLNMMQIMFNIINQINPDGPEEEEIDPVPAKSLSTICSG